MATKLGRKEMPAGRSAGDFEIVGRASRDQDDFGTDVGVADMACVNQFGEANNSKYYHGAVVTAGGRFYVYLEWGRMFNGISWSGGSFAGQDFQFVECTNESDARDFFAKQMADKNTRRGEWKTVASAKVWAAKDGKDGYIVQKLATRQKGLPDATKIKDATGIAPKATAAALPAAKKPTASSMRTYHPAVVKLAEDLVGGVKAYSKAMTAATGVTPTQDAIDTVRNVLVPAALQVIAKVGPDIAKQVKSADLRDLSKMVSAQVPREIPRSGISDEEAILSGGNILRLQQDLDAFEAALGNEDFEAEVKSNTVNPDSLLNAALRNIEMNTPEGKWLQAAFNKMTNNRHGNVRGTAKFRSAFAVSRPDRDIKFRASLEAVAAKRKGNFKLFANLQPPREDLGKDAQLYKDANVMLAIHGTRPVNIQPIMASNFRMPKSLPSAQISGANFGYGIYWATDWRKSYGYTGRGYWGHGGGEVKGRQCFMFLSDVIMGDAYRAPSTGSWDVAPGGKDSVFGVGGDRGHGLENDEHVIFTPDYQQIRYLVEFDWV